jgi:hypothetical protein
MKEIKKVKIIRAQNIGIKAIEVYFPTQVSVQCVFHVYSITWDLY